jgi:hypothetical protein
MCQAFDWGKTAEIIEFRDTRVQVQNLCVTDIQSVVLTIVFATGAPF